MRKGLELGLDSLAVTTLDVGMCRHYSKSDVCWHLTTRSRNHSMLAYAHKYGRPPTCGAQKAHCEAAKVRPQRAGPSFALLQGLVVSSHHLPALCNPQILIQPAIDGLCAHHRVFQARTRF